MPLLGAVASKAILRDCMERLQQVRLECGKDDENKQRTFDSTGDEFGDRVKLFGIRVEELRELAVERESSTSTDGSANAKERNAIRRLRAALTEDLDRIKKLWHASDDTHNMARQKDKAPEKVLKLKRIADERRVAFQNCSTLFTGVEEVVESALDMKPEVQRSLAKPTTRVRGALDVLRRARMARTTNEPIDGPSPHEVHEPVVSISEDPQYRAQMAKINEQKRKIDEGLARIEASVMRLRDLALGIGHELDAQQRAMAETEARVQEQSNKLHKLNKQVAEVMKHSNPYHICINLFCFVVLLGLVGYLLIYFDVVSF